MMNGSDNRQQELLWLIAKIAGVAILGGALYILGRLYLEEYYRYFGIALAALSFSTQDYMFSCLNVTLMVAGIAFWIWITSLDIKSETLWSQPRGKGWQNLLKDILEAGFLGFFIATILSAMLQGEITAWLVSRVKGWLGLLAGFGIGMAFFFLCDLTEYICRHFKTTWSLRNLFRPFGILYLTIIIFASLPYFSGKVAQWAAFAEFQNFPLVTVTSNALPLELQIKEETGDTHSVTGKLLIINNGFAYIFKSDTKETTKALVEFPKSGKVYAIRFSDIKYMVQYPINSSDNSTGKIKK
jgi:hypothetical protein